MTIRIKHEALVLPVGPVFALFIADLLAPYESEKTVTINFKDPTYSRDTGGYHPVEIRLENEGNGWRFCYITDFCFIGSSYTAELVKELDFDFDCGIFQNLFGTYPIEQATEMYQIWESNFVYYAMVAKVFTLKYTTD